MDTVDAVCADLLGEEPGIEKSLRTEVCQALRRRSGGWIYRLQRGHRQDIVTNTSDKKQAT